MINLKHIKNLLLLKPALNTRNLVTLVLVGSLFAIYAISGGKITTPPKVSPGGSFGEVRDVNGKELRMKRNIENATSTPEEILERSTSSSPNESLDRFEKNLKDIHEQKQIGQKIAEKERELKLGTGNIQPKNPNTEIIDAEKIVSPKTNSDSFSEIEERLKQLGK